MLQNGELAKGLIVTTLVFATYAVGVCAALLLAGRDSDVNGRRPVLLARVGLSVLSSVLFLLANGPAGLFAGRLISGFSAGLIPPTATAALVDLAGPAADGAVPLALGLVYRDRQDRTGPVLVVSRPQPGLPQSGRGTFVAAALGGFTAFALLGLFTALVPTLLFAVAVATQLIIRRLPPRRAIVLGLAVLVVGLGLLAASLDVASYPLFLAGTVVSGIAIGAAFSGGLATALSVASDNERGRVSSLFYLIAYAGITIPVVGAGFAVAYSTILTAFIIVGSVLAAFDLAALGYLRGR